MMLTIILVAIVLVLVVGAVVTGDWEKMDKLFGVVLLVIILYWLYQAFMSKREDPAFFKKVLVRFPALMKTFGDTAGVFSKVFLLSKNLKM